jgi:hypothetical protein
MPFELKIKDCWQHFWSLVLFENCQGWQFLPYGKNHVFIVAQCKAVNVKAACCQ